MDGQYVVDRQQSALIWQLPSISSENASGSMEFNCQGEDTESYFPVSVQFESERLICDVDVSSKLETDMVLGERVDERWARKPFKD